MAITATIASATSTSDAVDLGPGLFFNRVYVNNTALAQISIYASDDNSTFLPLYRNNSSVAGATFVAETIASAYSGFWVPIAVGHRYLKAVATGTVADGGTVKFSVIYK
jgi:hypothetical protein